MVDAVASEYLDQVEFVAVAGRSDLEASRRRVGTWFSPDRLQWGYDEELWRLYGIRGQPTTVLITSDGVVVDIVFGFGGEESVREALDLLVSYG